MDSLIRFDLYIHTQIDPYVIESNHGHPYLEKYYLNIICEKPLILGYMSSNFGYRIGFSSAMASNLTNQSRNIFSKKFMVHKEVRAFLLIILNFEQK